MSSEHKHFRGLMSKLIDGSADRSDQQQLRELLRSDPTLRAEYIGQMQIHALMRWQHPCKAESPDQRATPERSPVGGVMIGRRLLAVAAAGVLAVSLLLALMLSGLPDKAETATLAQSVAFEVLTADGVETLPGQENFAANQHYSAERIVIDSGVLRFRMQSGPVVRLLGPAEIDFLGSARIRMGRGKLTALVDETSEKLIVETAHTQIVDLGTEFGVDLAEDTHTDVVVFRGSVELRERDDRSHDKQPHTVLREGEAASVNQHMRVRRIENVVVQDHDFSWSTKTLATSSIIHSVRDNTRDPSAMFYYRIIPRGLREDATAYVAKRHEWNSLDSQPMPEWLMEADLVETFGGDRSNPDLQIEVTVREPAMLYVMYHARNDPPQWLTDGFEDTGVAIGLEFPRGLETGIPMGVGPGEGRLLPFVVWRRQVDALQTVTLGPPEQADSSDGPLMYGFAAKRLGD